MTDTPDVRHDSKSDTLVGWLGLVLGVLGAFGAVALHDPGRISLLLLGGAAAALGLVARRTRVGQIALILGVLVFVGGAVS